MNIIQRIAIALSAKPPQLTEFKSYESLGPVKFTDSYDKALKKLKHYAPQGTDVSMIKRDNKAIYIESGKIMIVFTDNAKSVLYFETERGSFIHAGNDIFKMGYKRAKAYVEKLDSNLKINEEGDGFDSPELGFTVTRSLRNDKYTDTIEYILVYSQDYTNYPRMTSDEIISYYFGEQEEDKNNQ